MMNCFNYETTSHERQDDGTWAHVVSDTEYVPPLSLSLSLSLPSNTHTHTHTHTHQHQRNRSYLVVDQSIDCTTSEYRTYRTVAQICLVAYGLGIPLVFILFVRYVWKRVGYHRTYVMFIFLLGGFKCKSWFWQAVIMVRKLCIGVIAVFVNGKDDQDASNDSLQAYVAIYVLTFFLVVHMYVEPYLDEDSAPYNKLETMSLAVTLFSLNLGLLYSWHEITTFVRNSVTVVLAIATFVVLIIFAYYILKTAWPAVLEVLDKDGDNKLTMRDLKLLLGRAEATREEKERVKRRLKLAAANARANERRLDQDQMAAGMELEETRKLNEKNMLAAANTKQLTAAQDAYNELTAAGDDRQLLEATPSPHHGTGSDSASPLSAHDSPFGRAARAQRYAFSSASPRNLEPRKMHRPRGNSPSLNTSFNSVAMAGMSTGQVPIKSVPGGLTVTSIAPPQRRG